ncbi:TIGR04086 family membrane protein, partial [Blautia schinkii]
MSGVCLLLLALLVFKLDIVKGPVTVGILVIYVLSCLAGGFLAGKILRQDKYRCGFLVV